ncbi:interferon-induced very large GTPase 1-like, partial [Scomber scombrus]
MKRRSCLPSETGSPQNSPPETKHSRWEEENSEDISEEEEEFFDAPDEPYCEEEDPPAKPHQCEAACVSVFTEPSPPVRVTITQVSSGSLSLCWDTPAGEVENYIVTCSSEEDSSWQELTTHTNSLTVSSLKPGVCYSLQVSTQLKNGRRSKPTVTSSCTKTHMESLLEDLGLEQHYKEKLSLTTVLQIDEKTINDESSK